MVSSATNYPVVDPGTTAGAGVSLRDYFAGQALMGACANNPSLNVSKDDVESMIARACYSIADAMLKARKDTAS